MKLKKPLSAAVLMLGLMAAAGAAGLEMPVVGTLVPRTAPDPKDDQWMVGCELLDRDFTKFAAYKDYLPQLGIRSIRLQGGWAKCEKVKGKYDFAWLDECVDFALAHGLNPVLETDYGNPIYAGGGGHDLSGGFPTSEEALAAWDRWVDALSKHFKGRVRDWLMWNEPDIPPMDGSPVKKPEAIAAFNVRTARIIRKNIPDARLAGLSLCATAPEFHEACYKAFGDDIKLFWRFIYHGYVPAPEESYGNVEQLKRLCAKYAPHARMWQGENGAPSEMSGDGLALHRIAWSEVSQAKWDMRRMLGDYVREIPSAVFTICDYFHPGRGVGCYGLLRADSARNVVGVKRAFAAVRNVATVFDSNVTRVPRRVSSPESSLQLWEFRRRGAPLFVFWTTGEWTWSKEKNSWSMAYRRPGDSLEKRPAVFSWPGAPLKDPVWVDLLTGEVRAFPKDGMKACAEGVMFTNVPVYDSPCLITERAAIDVTAGPVPCVAAGATIPKASSLSLNGAWQLKGWPTPDRGSVRTLEEVPAETISIPAKVPGCYELDLCAAGLLPDLFYANNQYAARKYEGHQWLYSRKFTLGTVASDEKAVLEFDGLDTLCDVFVNGRKIGEAADMFIPHAFDVTKFVRAGENELAVLFRSPVVESQFSEIAPIGNAGSTSELEAFRKPSHMIGWDILPRFISAGIFRDARVVVRKPERIREHFCALLSLDPEKRSAQYLLDLRLEGPFRRLDTSEIEVTVARKGKVVRRLNGKVMHWTPRFRFGIDNADLWWPLGFGEPALYDVKVAWRDCATKALLAEKNFKLGVKKVEFELADYDIATKNPGEMKFIVNGKPCFIRGTSWTPADALHCRDKDRIISTLELVREANCNMIRVWGGGLYEPEPFWDWCDANGVMVWQDFCFACTQYPQNNTSLQELVRRETIEVAKRLRNHASLTLWCGNNENDMVFRMGPWKAYGADPNQDVFSRRVLPEVLREFDPTHPYLPSSPYVNSDVVAGKVRSVEGHYYRRWWKGELFTATHEKFYSEFGCHGCPAAASIREMFSPDCHEPFVSPKEKNVMWDVRYVPYVPGEYLSNELAPGEPPRGVFEFNDQWVKRGVCVFENNLARSKFVACRNHRMVLQMHMLFGDVETDLEGFALQSQCAQAEGMKFIVEHCRSRKFDKKTGMTWWNIRDGWPVISDSVVEYNGRRKLAYEYIKRAQQNVLVMVDENGDVLVVNDLLRPVKGHATLTDAETGKTFFDGDFACGENAVAKAGAINLAGQGVVKIRYTVEGKEYASHYLYGGPSQKFVGEKKIKFSDYRRWLGL